MNIQKYKLILLAIIILAAVLRFYQLGTNPPSLNWDEVAHGYNAYSILKTGKDEFGYFLPLSIRSFDDYKPPLYTYLTVLPVALFGLNDFAIRFPSALISVFTILSAYLMIYELLGERSLANLSAFFLAISPWHIHYSRVAYEANLLIFFCTLAVWAFLKAMRKNNNKVTFYLIISALSFGLALFDYHTARLFVPVFSLILVCVYYKRLLKLKKYLIVPVIVAAFFTAVLIPIIASKSGQLRFEGTTVFADKSPLANSAEKIIIDEHIKLDFVGKILHNRRFAYVPTIIGNYFSHLNLNYLFFIGDGNTHHAPGLGLLYLWDSLFILGGIYFLISKKYEKNSKIIIFAWFLLAPVASSFTWGVPNSIRSEIYLPMFQIFAAIGAYTIYTYTKRKKLFVIVAGTLLVMNFAYYLHQYYVHMPIEYSADWLYGRKQAALISDDLKSNYDRVIVSTKLEQPHEFWLYYLKYDPAKYLSEGGTVSGGFLEDRNHFDKFFFKPIDFNKQSKEVKTLFVGLPSEFPTNANILKIINYLDGKPAIYIVSGV